jgi:hypothetical protein
MKGLKDGKINEERIEDKAILKSSNLTNPNSDNNPSIQKSDKS